MKLNRRILIESLFVLILIILIGFGWRILQGYFQTKKYVPDIIDSYESINNLESEVAFGIVYQSWIETAIRICGLVLLTGIYYSVRVYINRRSEKKLKE